MENQSNDLGCDDITTIFSICSTPIFELDLCWLKSTATINYACITQKCLSESIAKDVDKLFDGYLVRKDMNDFEGVEEFIKSRLTDPKKTRILYWSDADILEAARLREMFKVPGDNIDEANITLDKHKFKSYLKRADVKHADFVHFKLTNADDIESLITDVETKITHYPMFGKPANLDTARCTSKIHNQVELREYFIYTMGYLELEFMIETFLEGKHYQIEAIIKKGHVAFDMAMHYPNPCQSSLFGLPLGCYMIPYESEVYAKAHSALSRLIPYLTNFINGTIFLEFVYMNDDVYVIEGCRRKSGFPWMIFYYQAIGINFEEAYFKLAIDRFDFFIPDSLKFTCNVGCVLFMKQTGIVVKRHELPALSSSVTDLELSRIGEKSISANRDQKRDKSIILLLQKQ